MNTRFTLAALAATTVLVLPAAAQAHVTLQPKEAPAGGFTRLDVRVPNEEADKDTTKVAVKMPPGFLFASYEPVPGWSVKIQKQKLAKPVDDGHGGKISEQISQVTWTGDGKTGAIKPGQFQDFGLSVGIPDDKVGSKLSFKSLQTYTGGEVVRWIGPPESEKPAPQVTLTANPEEQDAADSAESGKADTANTSNAEPAAATTGGSNDGPSTGLVIVALVLGALGLIAGGASLARGRARA